MPKRTFPKQLFVKIETDGDISYFAADDEITSMVEVGETAKVAVYELRQVETVEGVVKVKAPAKAARRRG